MTLEEEGAYIRLLCYCWIHGSIPSEPEAIARLIGKGASTTLATTLATMFVPNGQNQLVHDRLEHERKKQALWREKSSLGGKKSAKLRKPLTDMISTDSRVVEGWLPNGTNQKATLLSSVSCLQSPNNTKREKVNFTPPTAEEVEAYSKEIGYPLNGQGWCDTYEQKGWMVGKSKMKSWKAAVRNWKTSGYRLGGSVKPVREPVYREVS
jgi:uncharacterized protein YdaU (DUF1376 family)